MLKSTSVKMTPKTGTTKAKVGKGVAKNPSVSAKKYGQYLANLLLATDYVDSVKASWAALVPHMTFDQLKQLQKILEKSLNKR